MRSLLPFLTAALTLVSAWDISNESDRRACQLKSKVSLEGCDQKRTVLVDAVGSSAKFHTVQSGRAHQLLPEPPG
jgi:hypothetical protein